MSDDFTSDELEAYLDELLPVERMAEIEEALRNDEELKARLTETNGRRDAGLHSLGGIWRRHRLSCPTREQLGSFLLGVLDEGESEYVQFHVETVACRYCSASLVDLRAQQEATDATGSEKRRHKYFQSSAGYLHPDE